MKKIIFLLILISFCYGQETFIKGRVATSEATRYIRVDTNGYLIISPSVAIASAETAPVFMRYTVPDSLFTAGANDTTTTAYKNMGAVIDMRGYTTLILYINVDINNSVGFRFKALGMINATTGAYPFQIETISSTDVKLNAEYVESQSTVDHSLILKIETDGVPYVQIQYSASTPRNGKVLSSYKSKIWK